MSSSNDKFGMDGGLWGMEKELDRLIDYFERLLSELESENQIVPDSEFAKGMKKGLLQALVVTRMYNQSEKGHSIDVEIDVPIAEKTVQIKYVQQKAEYKIFADPKNAKELRALVSQKPAFGVYLVNQYKQGKQ